jgi:serine/threonine protein kinase
MIGQTISHYRIVEKLGEGGMGVVYKAEDLKLGRAVALKFLRGDVLESAEHKERFLREAQAAAALDHPNICTVHEIDEAERKTFLAMAFVEGQSVKDKIAERPLKLEEARAGRKLRIAGQAPEAVVAEVQAKLAALFGIAV